MQSQYRLGEWLRGIHDCNGPPPKSVFVQIPVILMNYLWERKISSTLADVQRQTLAGVNK